MPVLEVRLLGPPTVRWAGRSLPILRRQTRILLYRLAVLGQALPREHLCFLFWPDIPEFKASRNLSHLLTHLRSALPVAEALVTYDDRVGLDPKRVWSDTQEFARLCNLTDSEDCIETLQRAVQFYRGPFLEGVSLASNSEFEAWMVQGRRTWEDRYLEALSTLIGKQTIAGELRAATVNAQRYLAVDHLDETMHCRLIELYAARGDRSAALHQYRLCATMLERELGVQPLPETKVAYQTVLHGEVLGEALAVTKPVWTTLPGPQAPLVGRQDVLAILRQAYVRACNGQGRIVLIAGEAGMGKSRLLQHFAAQLQDQAFTLVAAGQPGTQTLPYQLIIQSLRSQMTMIERASEAIASSQYGLSPIWLAEVARLLPELNIFCPGLPSSPPLQADEARSRLFEALNHFLHALATVVHPALLCLDNLAWSDSVTLDWLAYLGPRLRHMPMLIVGAYRNDEGDILDDLRQGYTRLGILTELELVGLDVKEVSQLTNHVTQSSAVDETLVRRLQHATAGNPFFVLQILRKLMESGEKPCRWHLLEDFPLPATISAAINARLESLDPVTRQVMEACAILAPAFNFDLVRLTSGRRELETLDSLDLLLNHHLLDATCDQYRFHHDLVRRVVDVNMSPMRRQLLHRRAGRALEQVNRQEVATLAYHYEAGNEPAKAVYFHELAAQRAEALFAWREAEEHRGRVRALQLH